MWASLMPGITVRPCRSTSRVAGPPSARTSWLAPTATMRSPRTAMASAQGRSESAVNIFPPYRINCGGGADGVRAADNTRQAIESRMNRLLEGSQHGGGATVQGRGKGEGRELL